METPARTSVALLSVILGAVCGTNRGRFSFYSWNHFRNEDLGKMHDDLLRAEFGQKEVSYVCQSSLLCPLRVSTDYQTDASIFIFVLLVQYISH